MQAMLFDWTPQGFENIDGGLVYCYEDGVGVIKRNRIINGRIIQVHYSYGGKTIDGETSIFLESYSQVIETHAYQ